MSQHYSTPTRWLVSELDRRERRCEHIKLIQQFITFHYTYDTYLFHENHSFHPFLAPPLSDTIIFIWWCFIKHFFKHITSSFSISFSLSVLSSWSVICLARSGFVVIVHDTKFDFSFHWLWIHTICTAKKNLEEQNKGLWPRHKIWKRKTIDFIWSLSYILMYLLLAGMRRELINNFQLNGKHNEKWIASRESRARETLNRNDVRLLKFTGTHRTHFILPVMFFSAQYLSEPSKNGCQMGRIRQYYHEKWFTITAFWQPIGMDCTRNMDTKANVELKRWIWWNQMRRDNAPKNVKWEKQRTIKIETCHRGKNLWKSTK